MRVAIALFLGMSAAGGSWAQTASLAGPVEGFTFDAPTRSLRALMGYPGASSFGPPLVNGVDAAAVAPQRNYAVAFQNGRCVFISGLDSNALATPLSGIALQPEEIVWSANGSLAILYSRSAGWFQAVTGFPQSPSAQARVDVTRLGGSLASIAADPKGQRIAVGISGAQGGVYWTSDRQAFQPVAAVSNPIALAFSTDGGTLYVLDGGTQQVISAGINTAGSLTYALGLADPVTMRAVAAGSSGDLLYVAGRSDQLLRVLNPATRQVVEDIPLAFRPGRLDPLGADSFVLSARTGNSTPLWLFSRVPVSGAFFVPAIPAASSGGALGVGGTQ